MVKKSYFDDEKPSNWDTHLSGPVDKSWGHRHSYALWFIGVVLVFSIVYQTIELSSTVSVFLLSTKRRGKVEYHPHPLWRRSFRVGIRSPTNAVFSTVPPVRERCCVVYLNTLVQNKCFFNKRWVLTMIHTNLSQPTLSQLVKRNFSRKQDSGLFF